MPVSDLALNCVLVRVRVCLSSVARLRPGCSLTSSLESDGSWKVTCRLPGVSGLHGVAQRLVLTSHLGPEPEPPVPLASKEDQKLSFGRWSWLSGFGGPDVENDTVLSLEDAAPKRARFQLRSELLASLGPPGSGNAHGLSPPLCALGGAGNQNHPVINNF